MIQIALRMYHVPEIIARISPEAACSFYLFIVQWARPCQCLRISTTRDDPDSSQNVPCTRNHAGDAGFRMRFSTNYSTTNWINLKVGIAMGCTISPILFVVAKEVIWKAAEGTAVPANLVGGCSMSPLKASVDDTIVICSKEDETRRMLTPLDVLMSWCRIEFKPEKSRSLSISKRQGCRSHDLHSSGTANTNSYSRTRQEPWKMV
ncbi:polyprotein [Plakobranchus ocellatus]|uniref:Polyprotein n=1 Tax=Plakobranchus ocellatus TaxID=259542 RepID=A0AAV3YJB8_9GAST|nr:polyprotein [Plakobranchus ocellatus]